MRENNMNINKSKDGNALNIALEGRLDTTTAPQLDEEIKSALDGIEKLVFDLAKLEYISSAGLIIISLVEDSILIIVSLMEYAVLIGITKLIGVLCIFRCFLNILIIVFVI